MGKTATESGDSTEPLPFQVALLFFGPAAGMTPWWARKFRFSHMAIAIEDLTWDQPMKGSGACYDTEEFLQDKFSKPRQSKAIVLTLPDHDPARMLATFKQIETKEGQPIRSVLRYLRIWRRPVWNCTAPARAVLLALDIVVRGETPDEIAAELEAPRFSACQRPAGGADE